MSRRCPNLDAVPDDGGAFWGSSVTPLTIWSVASIGEENVESQILQIIRDQSQQSRGTIHPYFFT